MQPSVFEKALSHKTVPSSNEQNDSKKDKFILLTEIQRFDSVKIIKLHVTKNNGV